MSECKHVLGMDGYSIGFFFDCIDLIKVKYNCYPENVQTKKKKQQTVGIYSDAGKFFAVKNLNFAAVFFRVLIVATRFIGQLLEYQNELSLCKCADDCLCWCCCCLSASFRSEHKIQF